MRVLIVPPEEFVPSHAPLSAIFQYHQACILRSRGLDVSVVSVSRSLAVRSLLISILRKATGKWAFYEPANQISLFATVRMLLDQLLRGTETIFEEQDGLSVVRVRVRCWSEVTPKESLRYFDRCLRLGYRLLKDRWGRPDIIHAHNAWLAGTSVIPIAATDGIPYCLTEHSTYYARNLIPERFFPLLKKVYDQAAASIVVSPALGELLTKKELLPDGWRYFPNVLDPLFEQPGISSHPVTAGKRFLNIAELTEKKGQTHLLKAFALAFKGDPEASLVIAGDGDLRDELHAEVKRLDISGQVIFTGRIDREEVLRQIQACDVFVLPSLVETFGVVVIEAMACGKPVVATTCGGPENFLLSEHGILVPPGDPEALASAMSLILSKLADYNPSSIRRYALTNFGSETFAENIIAIYEKMLAGHESHRG
ncbi:MAG: glycosyltransferase family 4 protein [Chitinophagia bacterium]|nr:glycosyltransferase family 4 protein [Chitinophagia bacterium]